MKHYSQYPVDIKTLGKHMIYYGENLPTKNWMRAPIFLSLIRKTIECGGKGTQWGLGAVCIREGLSCNGDNDYQLIVLIVPNADLKWQLHIDLKELNFLNSPVNSEQDALGRCEVALPLNMTWKFELFPEYLLVEFTFGKMATGKRLQTVP